MLNSAKSSNFVKYRFISLNTDYLHSPFLFCLYGYDEINPMITNVNITCKQQH